MVDYKEGNVKIDGIKIHYYRSGGKKPPFLLLHGATDNGLCWTRTAEELTDRYDVILMDAQGHGLSDRLDADFSYKSHIKQAAGLIKELKLNKPIIMGHSMGAGTAASVAADYPTLPKAVILEDPGWNMLSPNPNVTDEERKHDEAFRIRLPEIGKMRLQDIVIEGRKNYPNWGEEERAPWAMSKKQFDKDLFNRAVLNTRSYEEIVAEIQCPTLLFISEKGIVSKVTAEIAAKLWKSKKPFKWVYIKGAGHNIRREQYAAFKKALDEFLEEVG
jgi:N-formylmaleamate deformylase